VVQVFCRWMDACLCSCRTRTPTSYTPISSDFVNELGNELETIPIHFSLQSSVYSLQSSVYSLQSSVYSLQSSVFSLQSSVFSLQSSVFPPHFVPVASHRHLGQHGLIRLSGRFHGGNGVCLRKKLQHLAHERIGK
jgi:hypothetical protein